MLEPRLNGSARWQRRGVGACNIICMFNSSDYGTRVSDLLALDGLGERLMPLAHGTCSSRDAYKLLKASSPRELFPLSRAPEAAMAGLWMYFSCLDEAHNLAQAVDTPDRELLACHHAPSGARRRQRRVLVQASRSTRRLSRTPGCGCGSGICPRTGMGSFRLYRGVRRRSSPPGLR